MIHERMLRGKKDKGNHLQIYTYSVPYLALAKTFAEIEQNSGRLKIIELLRNLFRSVMLLTPVDLLQIVYLCVNKLAPEYQGIKLGVGESIIMKAIGEATGRTMTALKADYDQQGDLGLVANVRSMRY